MDNPQETFITIFRTKTTKAKNTTQKKKDESHRPHQQLGMSLCYCIFIRHYIVCLNENTLAHFSIRKLFTKSAAQKKDKQTEKEEKR